MFTESELYEWLMKLTPDLNGDRMMWEGLATKMWMQYKDTGSNKLFDVMEKAKNYEIIIPNIEMQKQWQFIKDNVEGKILSIEEFQRIMNGYTEITSTTDTTSL